MSVGEELAAARQRLGLSRDDISQRTKISVERLLAIEQEDLSNLPPLVYLKGFVREYAAAVQLDPDALTARYLGDLDDPAGLISTDPELPQSIDVQPLGSDSFLEEASIAFPEEASIAASQQVVPVVHESPPPRSVPPPASPAPQRPIRKVFLEDDGDLPPLEHTREVAPAPPFGPALEFDRPFRGGRVAVIVAVAVIAGFLVSANAGRIWPRATPSRPSPGTTAANSDPAPEVATAAQTRDSGDEAAVRASREAPEPSPSSPAPTSESAPASPPTSAASPASPSASAPTLPPRAAPRADAPAPAPPSTSTSSVTTPPVTAAPEPAPVAPAAPAPAAPAPALPAATANSSNDLTGAWSLTTRIEATDYAAYNNLNLGFRIQLQQRGERITGRGLKWMENGKAIPPRSRTPIVIEGMRVGDRLELHFTEQGTARTTTGTFVMDVEADGTLRGQFASTSANSAGSSIARRESVRD